MSGHWLGISKIVNSFLFFIFIFMIDKMAREYNIDPTDVELNSSTSGEKKGSAYTMKLSAKVQNLDK